MVLDGTIDAASPDDAELVSRLAVFTGDFDVEAAAAVLDVDPDDAAAMIARFLDASLVVASPEQAGSRRFRILWPVRELLLERSDPAASSARFAEHFRRIAVEFLGDADRPSEVQWLERHRVEDHNLRLALTWWEAHEPTVAVEFGPGLGRAWMLRGDQDEGRDVLHRLLARAPDAPSHLVAATELALGFLELLSGDAAASVTIGADAIERFERLGDPRWLSRALRLQAHALHLGGIDGTITDPIYRRSLGIARDAGLAYSQALTEVHFAHASAANEELDRADRLLDHAGAVLRRHGDHGSLAHAALGRALVAFGRNDAVACCHAGEEMLRQARLDVDTIWVQTASIVLALAWYELQDEERSHRFFRDAIHLAHDTANAAQLGIALHALAATSVADHPDEAATLWGAAGSLTPLWPLHARRYGEWMGQARTILGDDFDDAVAVGRALSVEEAVALADAIL
jgi:tetratricopeptide (TPR) repeat protein